eukprot:6203506-Pleurochrysis_carterae.AAC.1
MSLSHARQVASNLQTPCARALRSPLHSRRPQLPAMYKRAHAAEAAAVELRPACLCNGVRVRGRMRAGEC